MTENQKEKESIQKEPEIIVKEFPEAQDMRIIPRNDSLDEWKITTRIPYKDEILIGYSNTKTIYKIGDGIHYWNELEEVSLEEALDRGYIFYNGGINKIYKISLDFIPRRIIRGNI